MESFDIQRIVNQPIGLPITLRPHSAIYPDQPALIIRRFDTEWTHDTLSANMNARGFFYALAVTNTNDRPHLWLFQPDGTPEKLIRLESEISFMNDVMVYSSMAPGEGLIFARRGRLNDFLDRRIGQPIKGHSLSYNDFSEHIAPTNLALARIEAFREYTDIVLEAPGGRLEQEVHARWSNGPPTDRRAAGTHAQFDLGPSDVAENTLTVQAARRHRRASRTASVLEKHSFAQSYWRRLRPHESY